MSVWKQNLLALAVAAFIIGLTTGLVYWTAEPPRDYHQECRDAGGRWVDGPTTRAYCIYPEGY